MFFYTLKIALRNLRKHAFYSFINIIGLSVGLATTIMIALWVLSEFSYDRFLPNHENISQLWINATFDGKINSQRSSPFPAYLEIRQADSKIKNTCLADWGGSVLLAVGENKVVKETYHVSKEFLEVLPYTLIHGQANAVLADPTSIVLTKSTARALFGSKQPMGELVRVDNDRDLKVTGIVEDVPDAATLKFDCLLPIPHLGVWVKAGENDWSNYSWQVFVELQPNTTCAQVNSSIKNILAAKGQMDLPREFFLHPLPQWHLYTEFENGQPTGGLIDYVKGFSLMAIFILAMACINFMNLATARSESRAKEVGVRKAVGSQRRALIIQFLCESMVLVALSFALALIVVEFMFPFYNALTHKKLFLPYGSPLFWMISLLTIVVIGFISGSYPAFYLSSFNPLKVLKGKIDVGKRAITPRKMLVILQFALATFLIIGTLVVASQIQHAKKRSLGYDQANLITIQYTIDLEKNLKPLRQALEATGVVTAMTISNSHITDIVSQNFIDWEGKPSDQKVLFVTMATELDFVKTMGITLLQGRDFIGAADSSSVLVNHEAVKTMGLTEPIGATITIRNRKATIVGVIDDIVMGNPFRKPSPTVVLYDPIWSNALAVRIEKSADLPSALSKVEAVFRKFNPAYPFEYAFVDQKFAQRYSAINLINSLANIFTALAILITGLGILGLATFAAAQRNKEISIRKVMGASTQRLVAMMTKEFAWLVVIALAIAAPIAWWYFTDFLKRYPYHIDFPWWSMVFAGGIALSFALVIVSAIAFKAASVNPTKNLRSE